MLFGDRFISYFTLCCSALFRGAEGLPRAESPENDNYVRPLVLWHGLGDSASSAAMLKFIDLIRGVHPDIFVHSVYINEDNAKDQRAGFVSARRFLWWRVPNGECLLQLITIPIYPPC